MKLRRALIISLAIAISVFAFSKTALAQDVSAAFQENSNPHAICKYYRDNGYKVERESDDECLISMGEGQFITYTQYYYSGSNWCYKITQEGKNYAENCIPIPDSVVSTDDIEEYAPYIVGGIVIFGVIVAAGGASSANKKSKLAKQNSDPEAVETSETATDEQKSKDTKQFKVIRSGHTGSYGWEEMETGTTDTGEDMTKGPGIGQSQGGVGLHQGEPIVKPVASELERLVKLRKDGSISQREYNLAKKKLLK